MKAATLNNWALVGRRNIVNSVESMAIHIRGIVSDHPQHVDGTEITTSRIILRKGEVLITVNGTHYVLGSISPEYKKFSPNAKTELFSRIPETISEDTSLFMRDNKPK